MDDGQTGRQVWHERGVDRRRRSQLSGVCGRFSIVKSLVVVHTNGSRDCVGFITLLNRSARRTDAAGYRFVCVRGCDEGSVDINCSQSLHPRASGLLYFHQCLKQLVRNLYCSVHLRFRNFFPDPAVLNGSGNVTLLCCVACFEQGKYDRSRIGAACFRFLWSSTSEVEETCGRAQY